MAAIKESVCLRVKAVKVTRDRRHHRSMYAIHLPCVLYSRRVACQARPIGVTFSKYHWRGVRTGTRCRITCDTIFLAFTSLSLPLSGSNSWLFFRASNHILFKYSTFTNPGYLFFCRLSDRPAWSVHPFKD